MPLELDSRIRSLLQTAITYLLTNLSMKITGGSAARKGLELAGIQVGASSKFGGTEEDVGFLARKLTPSVI